MKIGVISIATGKYIKYMQDLVESCESFFLPGHDKKYFIFTDGDLEMYFGKKQGAPDVVKIHQEKLGWPFDSMLRFHMFLSIKEELLKMDYIFFMNANNQVVSTVDESVLPVSSICGIVSAIHPGFHGREKNQYTYERRPESSLFVPFGSENNYYQGCFNGGRSDSFLLMSEILRSKIDSDLNNNIIPVWHDESALNWYLIDKDPLVLGPNYAYPEHNTRDEIMDGIKNNQITIEDISEFEITNPPEIDPHSYVTQIGDIKITQRNKNKDGGRDYLRSK